jgi:hypothetical protein
LHLQIRLPYASRSRARVAQSAECRRNAVPRPSPTADTGPAVAPPLRRRRPGRRVPLLGPLALPTGRRWLRGAAGAPGPGTAEPSVATASRTTVNTRRRLTACLLRAMDLQAWLR